MFDQMTMQRYCDVDYEVTQDFFGFQTEVLEGNDVGDDESSFLSFTEGPLGNSTDVSLYYTMSVTRSDAYDIAVPTPVSVKIVEYTGMRIYDGQIIATAHGAKDEQDSSETATSSVSISSISSSTTSTTSTTSSASISTGSIDCSISNLGTGSSDSSTSGDSSASSVSSSNGAPSITVPAGSNAAAAHAKAAGLFAIAALAAVGL